MDADEALKFVEELLQASGEALNDLEGFVFLGTWSGQDYQQIHRHQCEHRCGIEHLKRNVGPGLWKKLEKVLEEPVKKSKLRRCVERAYKRQQRGESISDALWDHNQEGDRTVAALFPNPSNTPLAFSSVDEFPGSIPNSFVQKEPIVDWGTAPLDRPFYGRESELKALDRFVRAEGCRLIALYGMAGVGKTALALRLVQHLQDQYDFVVWRSLENAPSLAELTRDLVATSSQQQNTNGGLAELWHYFSNYHCLIVFDGVEAIVQEGVYNGDLRNSYEAYASFFQQIGSNAHRSCLIVTGWDVPGAIATLENESRYVLTREVNSFSPTEVKEMLTRQNCRGDDQLWRQLVRLYWGHPKALNLVAQTIRDLFEGSTEGFLREFDRSMILGELRSSLTQQLERLSESERAIVQYLYEQQSASFTNLRTALAQAIPPLELPKVLTSLKNRRGLIRSNRSNTYSLQYLIEEHLHLMGQSVGGSH